VPAWVTVTVALRPAIRPMMCNSQFPWPFRVALSDCPSKFTLDWPVNVSHPFNGSGDGTIQSQSHSVLSAAAGEVVPISAAKKAHIINRIDSPMVAVLSSPSTPNRFRQESSSAGEVHPLNSHPFADPNSSFVAARSAEEQSCAFEGVQLFEDQQAYAILVCPLTSANNQF
jgi:hypothetical protein